MQIVIRDKNLSLRARKPELKMCESRHSHSANRVGPYPKGMGRSAQAEKLNFLSSCETVKKAEFIRNAVGSAEVTASMGIKARIYSWHSYFFALLLGVKQSSKYVTSEHLTPPSVLRAAFRCTYVLHAFCLKKKIR